MNKVVAGDWLKKSVEVTLGGKPFIASPPTKIMLDASQVSSYEVVDSSSKVSTSSAVNRALVGSFFLGAAGLAAGMGAKKKGIYYIAIQFKNGFSSLLEVDDRVYKAIIKSLFNVKPEAPAPIPDQNQKQPQISIADELKKYKELLDTGALTEEEFLQLKLDLMNNKTCKKESSSIQSQAASPETVKQKTNIFRKPRFIASGAAYEILLDDEWVGKIKNGETLSFNLDPGKHIISFFLNKAALKRNNSLGSMEFEINYDDELCLEVETKSLCSVSIKIVK